MTKGFLNKSENGLPNELSQIFIILMEISSWPRALFTSSDLFVFDISSKLKTIEWSLDGVRTCWLVERGTFVLQKTTFFNQLLNQFYIAQIIVEKNLWNMFAFVFYILQIYHLLKEVELKEFWIVGSFNFFPKTSSLGSAIKFLRFKQLPSFLPLFIHTL